MHSIFFKNRVVRIQKIWAFIIGIVSTTVGVLKLIDVVNIPFSDAIVHIATGIVLLFSSFIRKGIYAGRTNIFIGIFYLGFGIGGSFNWPHMILGLLTFTLGILNYL